MKSIKKWCEEHGWLLSLVGALTTIIKDLDMDIINSVIMRYGIFSLVMCWTLISYIRNESNYAFRLTDEGKPQFLRLKRPPLHLSSDLISFLPDEDRKKARDKNWSYKKLLRKVKKLSKNP